jgi:DHA1 family tetracycline resistance protein-like MFS transporter
MLLLSSFGLGVDYILMALAPNLWILLLARLLSGATAASFVTTHAYVADITDKEGRAALFGKLASSISLGYLVGPAFGGWLGDFDLRLPYVVASAVTLANAVYGLVVLPESLPAERRRAKIAVNTVFNASGIIFLFKNRTLSLLAATSFFGSLSNMIWGSVWVLFCTLRFGWSPFEMGLAILAAGALGIGVQTWAVGRIVALVGERRALLIGATAGCLALLCAGLATNTWYYAISIVPGAIALLFGPGLQGLLSGAASPDKQGTVRGGLQALGGVATIIGPLIYGAVFSWSVKQTSGYDLSGLAVFLSAAFMACSFFSARRLREEAACSENLSAVDPSRNASVALGPSSPKSAPE